MNNICPVCNTSYPDDVKFCINDGTVLTTTPTPQPTDNPLAVNNPFEPKRTTHMGYAKADMGNRFLAALLDGLIVLALAIPGCIFFFLAFMAAYGREDSLTILFGLLGLLLILLPIAYQLLKDGFGQGQSYGKRALKLVVIDLETNKPINKSKSLVRNIVSCLLGLVPIVGNFIEPIMVLATEDGRKLGDRAANTMVIDKIEPSTKTLL